MSLNDFLHHLGWIFIGYESVIVLWFIITQLPKYHLSLFFTRRGVLNSLELHEMHSCFMSAVLFISFHMVSSELEQYLLSFEFEQVMRI